MLYVEGSHRCRSEDMSGGGGRLAAGAAAAASAPALDLTSAAPGDDSAALFMAHNTTRRNCEQGGEVMPSADEETNYLRAEWFASKLSGGEGGGCLDCSGRQMLQFLNYFKIANFPFNF
jgi:hypothetical protein